jgi:formylglycine-generating enzyme required for sulfatase activity
MIIGGVIIPLLVLIGLGVAVFRILWNASPDLTVPKQDVLLVRTAPDEQAPLLARFGPGHPFHVTGRSADWRWLEVETWDGQRGWALRPLDILVWQITAAETIPVSVAESPQAAIAAEEMVAIPGGAFTMGSPPGLGDNDETPVRTVTLSPYQIDRTEVTLGNYWQCVSAGKCTPPHDDASSNEAHYSTNPAFDNYPVIHVTWEQANTYCNWRGKRLPTEAEWEMAAGWDAGTGAKSLWPWGNDPNASQVNIGVGAAKGPMAAGANLADISPNGVLDMGGNVREWVFDWYKVNYYSAAENSDPRGPTYRRGEGEGRVVRGGFYADGIETARTANRGFDDSVYGQAMIGFRCTQGQ